MINKIKFEQDYINRSEISLEEYQEWFVTLPCKCGASDCEGWSAVHANYHSVGIHVDLYMLSDEDPQNYFNKEEI